MATTEFRLLSEVTPTARSIVERIIWCTVTTVGVDGEPRSRLMHPVWDWSGPEPVALVTARPTKLKVEHLSDNPRVACFYWDPAHATVAIDGTAEWLALDERAAAWEKVAATPEPVGFDPSMIWPTGPAAEDCRFLRLAARRIIATQPGESAIGWRI